MTGTSSSAASGSSGRAAAQAAARAGGVLAATCLSTFVVNANTSAVSILLPAISADTGMDVTTLQWAVTGYSLVGAAVIVTSGSLGDVFGRKRVFQLGLMLFVVSCIFIALSSSGGAVIAGRVIQGAAGATILACGLSLLSVANDGQAQLRAVSLWGAAAAVGAAAGPLMGGVLVSVMGWQGLFWVDAVIAVVCILITARRVSESRDTTRSRSIDYAGSIAHRADPGAAHPRAEQGRRLGLGVGRHARAASPSVSRQDSPSSPSSGGWPSRCSTSDCCATASSSARRSPSSSVPAPSTR